MGKFDRHSFQGDLPRELNAQRAHSRRVGAERSAEQTTIGRGGLTVNNEGSIRIDGAGGRAGMEVLNDGVLFIAAGETFDSLTVRLGRLSLPDDPTFLRGLAVWHQGTGNEVFRAAEGFDGLAHVYQGWVDQRLNQAWTWSEQITLDASAFIQLLTPERNSVDSANVFITSSGNVQILTSTLATKTNLRAPLLTPEMVLALEPREWQDPTELEKYGESARWGIGFVAEDIVGRGEPALEPLVTRGEDGAPRGVNYSRVPAAQQIVLRDHETRLAAAEAEAAALRATVTQQAEQIAALTARLDALEATP